MTIRFSCSHCQQKLKAADDKTGRRIACPKCKTKLTVPSADAAEEPFAVVEGGEAADEFAELVVYEDEIVYESEDKPKSESRREDFDRRLIAISRRLIYAHAILLFVLAAAGFGAGYAIGLLGRQGASVEEPPPQRVLIQGRIQWEATTGLLADKGAVVIALPSGLETERKLPGESLGPETPVPQKGDDLILTIESWGGDYTRTNDVGEFELFLLPGKYQLLMVSHQAERLANVEPDRDDLAALGKFFSAPHELIGLYEYRWFVKELDEDSQILHDFAQAE